MAETPIPTGKAAAKKAADILVLHCLNPECRGLLAYEVDGDNVLHVDLAWTATRDGGVRYFPCPTCQGRNVIEAVHDDQGRLKHKVVRWEAGRERR